MTCEGKVALITGSTGEGMGRSTAFVLANNGADIVLNFGTFHRDAEAERCAKKVEKAIKDMGRREVLVKADTKKEDEVCGMVEKAVSEFGKIDILVNNAGGGWEPRDYTEIPFEHFKEVLAAEIDGAFLTMKHIVPGMRKRKWGRIIHIGLDNALRMQNMAGVAPDYCLGKTVRAWMTTAFGLQEFKQGITVNCIEPGPTAHMSFEDALKAAKGDYSNWQQRDGSCAHDVAETIAFLCSEAARFISGSTIRLPMT
jgi:3-oxoacyl-[acyl-carrier protein] reductase